MFAFNPKIEPLLGQCIGTLGRIEIAGWVDAYWCGTYFDQPNIVVDIVNILLSEKNDIEREADARRRQQR